MGKIKYFPESDFYAVFYLCQYKKKQNKAIQINQQGKMPNMSKESNRVRN